MYVCVYLCMCVCIYVCVPVCLCVCKYACMHACMYVCMYACYQVGGHAGVCGGMPQGKVGLCFYFKIVFISIECPLLLITPFSPHPITPSSPPLGCLPGGYREQPSTVSPSANPIRCPCGSGHSWQNSS